MACRVWLADPAEFEAQPAGFGKRPGPPTSEERDLAASAAALWNALASDAAPRYAEDPEALGRLELRGNQPLVRGILTKLQTSRARSHRSRFG